MRNKKLQKLYSRLIGIVFIIFVIKLQAIKALFNKNLSPYA